MVSAANAQLKKGDLLVGGNIGLTLNIGESEGFSDETDVDVTFSLTPGVTYMLTDNWYIGGELGVSVGPGNDKHIYPWAERRLLRAVQQDDWDDEYRRHGIRRSR